MKAIIKFRNYEKGSKVLPFSIPEKVGNVLCDTRIGIKDVTFK